MSNTPLRCAILGAGRRAMDYFIPILRALPETEIVSAWSRSVASAQRIGDIADAPFFTDLDRLVDATSPDIAVVCVNAHANGKVGLAAANRGLHLLLETPIAFDLREADAIISAGDNAKIKIEIEVAEQFHLRPIEQLKLACIKSGLFGDIHLAMNDLEGHGYHGVSQMRSYLGFDAQPSRILSATPKYTICDRAGESIEEHQEHAIVEFQTGRTGLHHWSSVAYDSPVRGGVGGRFYGSRGSWETFRINGEQMHSIRVAGADAPGLCIERDERSGVLQSLRAVEQGGEGRAVEWHNPLATVQAAAGVTWSDDEIAVATCLRSLTDAVLNSIPVRYGPHQARTDQLIANAIWEAAREGGVKTLST